MGEYKSLQQSTPSAAPRAPVGPAGPATAHAHGNAAAAARLSRQGEAPAPDVAAGLKGGSAARTGTGLGIKGLDQLMARTTGTAPLLAGIEAGKTLGKVGGVLGGGLSAAAHFAGDRMVTDDVFGHAAASAAKAGGDTVLSAACPWGALTGVVDAMVPADSALKPVTSMVDQGNPLNQAKKGVAAGVDTVSFMGAALDSPAAAYRSADVMEGNAVDGNYGPLPQVGTALVALATGDQEVASRYTDAGAESGERGPFVQAGNHLADGMWNSMEELSESYDRSQAGIQAGAAALVDRRSPEELARAEQIQALLADRWVR